MSHLFAVTWQHLRRSPYQAAAALMIMSLTIFAALAFFLLSLGSQKLLTYVQSRPQVIAFFDDTITSEDQVADLKKSLLLTSKVGKMTFVSKDQALAIYRDRNKNDPLLLELVTANTLPASLEVSAKDVTDLPQLYTVLSKAPNIEEISYQQDVVNTLIVVVDRVRKFGVGLIIFLTLASIFTILTIIGMKIALRRKEIEVERLVGATDLYISLPFLLEGLFYGVAAAVFSWAIIYGLIFLATPHLLSFLGGLHILPVTPLFMAEVLGGTILAGSLVGITGSMVAVLRYLRTQN